MGQLQAVLDATQSIDPDHGVCQTLAALAPRFTFECVRCVDGIVRGDRHDWAILGNREHIETILKMALGSDSIDAKAAAERLIEYLVGRGHFEYRRFLS
jgi:hypothetical protein